MAEASNAASTTDSLPVGDGDNPTEEAVVVKIENDPVTVEPVEEERETWGSKLSYMLTLVGYAVGFGNIWRFPALLHANGGVAFLIPYLVMLAIAGIPIFFLELAIGQRLKKGGLGAWNEISPYLGGVGISCGVLCYLVCIYYNTLIAWVLSYLFDSFRNPLPWRDCATASSGLDTKTFITDKTLEKKVSDECIAANSPSKFYWFRRVMDISDSIEVAGNFNPWIMLYLIISWIVIWGILVKGLKVSGKVVYFTALFPYVTLFCFFIGNFFVPGWDDGYMVLFKPDWKVLVDIKVWLRAGTQIFFSLGVAFGCLIVFASYLPSNNNCYRDAISVSIINCSTSLLAAIVIFPVLGSLGYRKYYECMGLRTFTLIKDLKGLNTGYKLPSIDFTYRDPKAVKELMEKFIINKDQDPEIAGMGLIYNFTYNGVLTNLTTPIELSEPVNCKTKEKYIKEAGGGTGLVFIAFAEAAVHLPCPQFWCFMFFFMLFTLGIDSSFGTCEGAVGALADSKFLPWPRWALTSLICGSLMMFSMVFTFGFGIYVQDFIDKFVANWSLLAIAIFETIGVAWVYGLAQFSYDVMLMTGKKPNVFMLICWKFISPVVLIGILIASIIDQFSSGYEYDKYNKNKGSIIEKPEDKQYPSHVIAVGYILFTVSIIWVPLQAILVYFGKSLLKIEKPAYFPENELRAERNIDEDADDLDNFGNLDKLLMGQKSIDDFAAYRERAKSTTSLEKTDGKAENA